MIKFPDELSHPIGIVACDAGAANLIAGWKHLIQPSWLCLDGPAVPIIQKAWPAVPWSNLDEIIVNSRAVLTGTGWSSDLEHNARMRAKEHGIFTMAVIDHWVNYRARFSRNHEILPDCIIVTDKYAELEARRCFNHVQILSWPNLYMQKEIEKIKKLRGTSAVKKIKEVRNVLMVMEPIRDKWPGVLQQQEFFAAHYFISNLQALSMEKSQIHIRVRPHPADPYGKYTRMLYDYASPEITLSDNTCLAKDIAWADLVVGCESFALIIALEAGIPTLSILPKQAPQCRLPHHDLMHLAKLLN